MNHRHTIFLLGLSLTSCHMNNGRLDMSWVTDRMTPGVNDAVVVEQGQGMKSPASATPQQTLPHPALQPNTAGVPGQGYTVRRGDTLSSIARRYGVSVASLKQANGLSGDNINQGQMLSIPGSIRTGAEPLAAKSTSLRSGGSYTVRPGDTFSSIAHRHGIGTDTLLKANKRTRSNGDTLKAGEVILIPNLTR